MKEECRLLLLINSARINESVDYCDVSCVLLVRRCECCESTVYALVLNVCLFCFVELLFAELCCTLTEMPRTVDLECPSCHHIFGDITKLRRHTMAMYGCWPRLKEGATCYQLTIPSDAEHRWFKERTTGSARQGRSTRSGRLRHR